jgi:acyl-CoA synthetase (AMP-forming)/AMP-acid ligase II
MAIQLPPFRSMRAEDNGFVPRAGFEPFVISGTEQTIVQRFSDVAHKRGAAVAVVAGQDVIGYRELLKRASGIGAMLRTRLGMRPGPVIIRLPAGGAAIEALLGVLFSGRSYLFLPLRTGSDALDDLIVAAVPVAQIVAADEPPTGGPSEAEAPWSTITIGDLRSSDGSAEKMDSHAEPGDLACLFATSGTTGTPKLVGPCASGRTIASTSWRTRRSACHWPQSSRPF